jgi:agmatine/peptidylarginine deiminase
MPDALYDKGERLPATYANFVITNSSILYPTYNQPEKDSLAGEILSGAFPGRKITGIDAQTAIRQHGSLHCLTMQYPEGIIRSKVQKQE